MPIHDAASKVSQSLESGPTSVERWNRTADIPPLQPIELGKFIGMKLPQPVPILGNLLHEGTLMMVYGPAGAGKTFLKLSIAIGAAYGVEVLGWMPPAPVPVVYIDGEMVARVLQQRGNDLVSPVLASIKHVWKPLLIVTPDLQPHGIRAIDQPEGKAAVIDLVKEHGARLLVLDNLSCLTNPEDDNAATSWTAVQELLLAMRRGGVAVIVGHHAGKSGAQRGTSRRADILDVILKLSPITDTEADGRTRVNVEFEKGRSLTSTEKEPFIATLEPHPLGGLVWSRSGPAIPKTERIREMLLSGMPATAVAIELATATSFVYRVRSELQKSGELPARGKNSTARVIPLSPPKRGGKGRNVRARGEGKRGI
jgi:putative DNA primase/helicase